MNKIAAINTVLQQFFSNNPSVITIPAKDMMPDFIKAGIFEKDEKKGLPIRKVLRKLDKERQLHLIPYVIAERKSINTNWFFGRTGKFVLQKPVAKKQLQSAAINKIPIVSKSKRADSDEAYVLNLCDEVIGIKGIRQHRFVFLLGDAGTKLPVDIYYSSLNLVFEYRETQHTNAVKHFDKPDVLTVSGVHRGVQRELYDQRRRDVLPRHGITLIELGYFDFSHDKKHRIKRDHAKDIKIVSSKLASIIKV
ncbi:hypothetical protein [Parafilimonas terrae]|uniref:Uncharacterized protein n=1 Tax=Parafilimonas terrae TaxID=1465490 RepID=A0A1I5WE74_9BACT|nr:hypothetical protein [Parafilimonas terrae]SFQ18042.1 hypothetical protein SAMN05444277_106128 [Parafilimonas terrae]